MTAEFLTAQAATSHWAWTIALFLWFVGLAGMSLFLNVWLKSKRVFYIATGAALIGTLLVLSHLGRLLNLPVAAFNALMNWSFNFSSWMFIGICILAVLCIVTVLQSIALWQGTKKGKDCPWATSGYMAVFDAVLGVAATAYSGFLLTQAVGVPLWTTAVLPILWIFSGLACAVGLAEILVSLDKLEGGHPHWLGTAANGVHIGEALVLFAFVQVAFFGTPGAVAGAESLISGNASMLFWAGAVGLGIVVPVAIAWAGVKARGAILVGGLCALAGALALRAAVLFAGYFDPTIF
ncbi:MAG: polysulfide reductase NrfD [Sutterellaceae bacterium]|nr:polysulfide reductase NrfD [Sutterellaceae bacterium]